MTSGVRLILSGAYVEQELAAEFGRLPPAFLPVGTQRLYELQINNFPGPEPLYLTLPDSFAVPEADRVRLARLGVNLLTTPEGLTLGQAVVWAINYIGVAENPVRILHGDTLIIQLPVEQADALAVGTKGDSYSWAEVEVANGRVVALETITDGGSKDSQAPIACGYFGFSRGMSLVRAITRSGGKFVEGINQYAAECLITAVPIETWLDFGHVQTFFRSRRAITAARAFNSLRIDGHKVHKSSRDRAKIRAEAAWLARVPPAIQVYCARLIAADACAGEPFYETEYEYIPSLAELFVYGANSRVSWMQIMGSCDEFLQACAGLRGPGSASTALRELASAKTLVRLEQFAKDTGFNIEQPTIYAGQPMPSLLRIAEELDAFVDFRSPRRETVMHGDFCFSNILFNFRVRRIKVIDPRGFVTAGEPTIFGDPRYDLAKLAHSIIGLYDQIVAGRYQAVRRGYEFTIAFDSAPHHRWLEAALGDIVVDGCTGCDPEVRAIMTGLFLSMLPLHADDPERQHAFIANALRLYAELDRPTA